MEEWIEKRGCELAAKHGSPWAALHALIAEHEEAPVDPLDAEVERLLEVFWAAPNQGSKDLALAALRRGVELGQAK